MQLIVHVARREWLEQTRHPAMLWICAGLLVCVAALTVTALASLTLLEDPAQHATLAGLAGMPADTFLEVAGQTALAAFNFLIYSQYLGFVGVVAGHAVLHDRQLSTLPFLLLAPIPRWKLLAGKLLGALAPLTAITLVLAAAGGLVVSALPIADRFPTMAVRSASWWAALLLAGPAWGAFVAAAAVTISAVARDVRLAQQAVWLVVFFVQLLVAFLITGSLDSLAAQLFAAALGACATLGTLALGTTLLAGDLGR